MTTGSDVSISITVVDRNGVATVQELQSAMASVGAAAERGGRAAAEAIDSIGEHSITNLDKVRLLRDDLGIRMPRAMEKLIATSGVLSGAIGAIGGGLVAVGAIDILARIGEEIYAAYEKWVDVDAVTQQYQKHLDEIALKKFLDPGQVAEAIQNLHQVGAQLDALNAKKTAAPWGFFQPLIGGQAYTPADEKRRTGLLDEQRQLGENAQRYSNESLAHGLAEQEKAFNDLERGYQRITDLKGIADARTRNKFDEGGFGDTSQDYSAAYDKYQDELTDNAAEATAKRIALGREEAQEIQRMRAEALQAGLQGNALYAAQEQAAIDQLTLKFHQGETSKQAYLAETAALRDKFTAEAQARQDELDERVRKSTAGTAAAGMTGIARIQAELQSALEAIDEEEHKAVGKGGTETDAQRRDFAQLRTNAGASSAQKQAEAERQYYQEMNQMSEAYTAQSLEGYAKISADADKSAQEVWTKWSATWGQLESGDMRWVLSVADAVGRAGQAYSNAETERARLHQQTMDSLAREEQAAARDSLPPWIAAELNIVDTYKDRVQKDKEALAAQKIQWDEFEADRMAAGAVASAQLQKQMEETRDKLASSLSSFFQNPAKFLENRAMETAFQYMGNEMLQVFQNHSTNPGVGMLGWLFGMNGQASTSTNPQTFGRSLFNVGGSQTSGIADFQVFSSGATAFETAMPTFQTGTQMLLQAAQNFLAFGGGGNAGSDLALQGFGGISAGSSGAPGGGSTGGSTGGGGDMGSAGLGGAGISDALSGSSGPNANGSFGGAISGGLNQNAATTAGTAASPWLGAGGAAITGAMGLFSAYQNSNPIAGGVSGAMSGAAIGSAFMPGVGTAIGAVVGGIAGILAGIFGDKGKGEAQQLDWKTIQPGIAAELQAYNNGSAGYEQVSQYLNQLQIQAIQQTNAWGSGARGWYSGHILPEIQAAQAELAREEKGNRSLVALSAAQYHVGGTINDFGDLAINSSEGYILAQRGETMMNANAASTYAPLLSAMNSGALSPAMLRGNQMVSAGSSTSGPEVHLHIEAMDAQSFIDWGRRGGATQIRQLLNGATSQYGGIGVR